MILPIVAFGDPILKKVALDIDKSFVDLNLLLANMFETMYKSHGVGLAAPQIGKSIRVFIVDTYPFEEDYPEDKEFKKVDVEMTVMSIMGIVRMYITSGSMACKILNIKNEEDAFDQKQRNRLKKHLRELLVNHLQIK